MKKDLATGSAAKNLLVFTLPLILSGLFQQLFNWVDAFLVGNVAGELALAGIGATTSIYALFVNVITGFTTGLSILSAQQYGMEETDRIRKTLLKHGEQQSSVPLHSGIFRGQYGVRHIFRDGVGLRSRRRCGLIALFGLTPESWPSEKTFSIRLQDFISFMV